jgi:aminopeptidase N
LDAFFNQWIFRGGHPHVELSWRYDERGKFWSATILQQKGNFFQFPLEVAIVGESGEEQWVQIPVTQVKQAWRTSLSFKPTAVRLDPGVKLLFEGKTKQR